MNDGNLTGVIVESPIFKGDILVSRIEDFNPLVVLAFLVALVAGSDGEVNFIENIDRDFSIAGSNSSGRAGISGLGIAAGACANCDLVINVGVISLSDKAEIVETEVNDIG